MSPEAMTMPVARPEAWSEQVCNKICFLRTRKRASEGSEASWMGTASEMMSPKAITMPVAQPEA
eukprot:8369951-Alexandrium_andersonii.AAC.1